MNKELIQEIEAFCDEYLHKSKIIKVFTIGINTRDIQEAGRKTSFEITKKD